MKRKIRVCMIGMGRTGREVAAEILNAPDMKLVMAVCGGHSTYMGQDIGVVTGAGLMGVMVEDSKDLDNRLTITKPDVAIDFTTPEAVMANATIFARHKVKMVIGTTGFNEKQLYELRGIAKKYHTGIVSAPNITLGVNVLMAMVNLASTLLEEYDCSIVETHFKKKKDSPSGTALKIADEAIMGIAARTKNADANDIPIHSLRTGGVIGRHSVILAGEYDRVEISHESFSRKAFAVGALRASRFVAGRSGYFEMRDVLNLDKALVSFSDAMKDAI